MRQLTFDCCGRGNGCGGAAILVQGRHPEGPGSGLYVAEREPEGEGGCALRLQQENRMSEVCYSRRISAVLAAFACLAQPAAARQLGFAPKCRPYGTSEPAKSHHAGFVQRRHQVGLHPMASAVMDHFHLVAATVKEDWCPKTGCCVSGSAALQTDVHASGWEYPLPASGAVPGDWRAAIGGRGLERQRGSQRCR